MAVIGTPKWACQACTYHNWSSATKCVLCSSPKPVEIIPKSPPGRYRSQNLTSTTRPKTTCVSSNYSMSGASYSPQIICDYPTSSSADTTGRNKAHSNETPKKWVCSFCTYSNWPNANQCTMCRNSRSKRRYEPLSRSRESILDYASHVGAVGGAAYASGDENMHGSRDSPPVHTIKVKGGKNGNKLAANLENRATRKWKCHRCTYENWPRNLKCAMCQKPKRLSPSPPPSEHQDSSSFALRDISVPSQSRSYNSNEAGAMGPHAEVSASSASCSGNTCRRLLSYTGDVPEILPSSNLKSTSDEVRQIRNRLSSSDWLFLNACLGVVNNDEPPVKAYLRQDGDRARQLSKSECLVLGEPSKFSVGSTLVHLAIR